MLGHNFVYVNFILSNKKFIDTPQLSICMHIQTLLTSFTKIVCLFYLPLNSNAFFFCFFFCFFFLSYINFLHSTIIIIVVLSHLRSHG